MPPAPTLPPRSLNGMEADVVRAEAKRLAALTSPAAMGRFLDPHHYYARAHHKLISNALTHLGRNYDRLMVNLPPQTGKSSLVSELLPFWTLARDPRARIVIASYAASLALKKSRAVRRHINDHGHHYGLALQRGEASVYDWSLTAGGGVRAVGVGGSLTGFPAHLLVVDDPHKDRRDADSLRMRDRVWEWWSAVALSRLRPGAPVLLTQTRWHEDDLAGRVLAHEGTVEQGGRWKVINLPAVATHPADPLGRGIGAPLTHPALDDTDSTALAAHWADKKATSTPRDWGALYMGDPQPAEGALLTRTQLAGQRRLGGHPDVPAPERIAVAVDPSGSSHGDTAGIIGGFRGTDGRLYYTHDRTRRMGSAEWSRRACLLAWETTATVIYVESHYGGDMVSLAIATAWDALTREGAIPADAIKPYVSTVSARTGKYLRAEPIAQQWIEDRVRTAAYLPELEEEWATWQPDQTDSPGRLDASVYLAYGLIKVPGASQHIGNAAGVSLSTAAATQRPGALSGVRIERSGPGMPRR